MKVGTNIQHVSGTAEKVRGQSSRVKVRTRLNSITLEACILTVWCRGSFILVVSVILLKSALVY